MEIVNMIATESWAEMHTIYKTERESNSNKGFNIPLVCPRFQGKKPHQNYTKENKIPGPGKYPPPPT